MIDLYILKRYLRNNRESACQKQQAGVGLDLFAIMIIKMIITPSAP